MQKKKEQGKQLGDRVLNKHYKILERWAKTDKVKRVTITREAIHIYNEWRKGDLVL